MDLFRRYLINLHTAFLAGLAAIVRMLANFVQSEQQLQMSGIESVLLQRSTHLMTPSGDMPSLPEKVASKPNHEQEIEYLHGNPDTQDTAMFRLPDQKMRRTVTLDMSEKEYYTLQAVCQQEDGVSQLRVILNAVNLYSQVAPKIKEGYILRLERTDETELKKTFIFE